MAKTRVAVICLGMAAAPHARSLIDLADWVEVAAAYSPSEARRAEFARTCGLPLTGNVDGIFADRTIEAVMLLTTPNTQLDLVRRAAAAGKHTLLEKPLEISVEGAEAVVAVAADAGGILSVVLQNRLRSSSMALARLISEGRLGRLVSAAARLRSWARRAAMTCPAGAPRPATAAAYC